MNKNEMQRFLDQEAAEGKTKAEALEKLRKVLGLEWWSEEKEKK